MQMHKYSKFNIKAYFHRSAIIVGVLILAAVAGTILVKSSPLAKAGVDDSAESRLLRDLAMLPVPDQAAPVDFSLPDTEGRMVNMADFRGKVVFLNFWTTWCLECRIEMPAMERLYRRLPKSDFAMVTISLRETADTVKRFFTQHELTFTALLDKSGDIGMKYAIRAIPTTFILDRRGHIIGMALGARKWDAPKTVKLIERLLDEKRIDLIPKFS
jgi:peroxiredoxin